LNTTQIKLSKHKTPRVLLFVALFVCFFNYVARAQDVKIVENFLITEVMFDPAGSNTQHAKWIEIYNDGEDFVFTGTKYQDLYKINDFYACDSLSSTTNKCVKHSLYMQSATLTLKKGEYVIVATNIEQFENDFVDVKAPIMKSSLGITGTEKAFVKFCLIDDNNCGESVLYGAFKVENSEGYSLEKIKIKLDNEKENWQQSAEIGGTPGKENSAGFVAEKSMNSALIENSDIKINMDDEVYENMYAYFEIQKNENEKVAWEFGDGHKSYLAKTKHKFEKVGVYEASVKIYNDAISVIKNFLITVESFPHPKVRIIEINANPDGADTKNESITIENKSKKKINLKNWSIATGWKKFINHPIKEDVIIKKKKTKKITSDVSSFSLSNTKAKIQLRYPDGKVAQQVKYKKVDSIGDGEIYQKAKGGWKWVNTQKSSVISSQSFEDKNNNQNATNNIQNTLGQEIITNKQEIVEMLVADQSAQVSENNMEIVQSKIKSENKLLSINDGKVKIELLKNVSGMSGNEKMHEVGNSYVLISQPFVQDHYAVRFFRKVKFFFNNEINKSLNWIIM
jgi:hypothetical protein